MNVTHQVSIQRCKSAQPAAPTPITGDTVDLKGFDSVLFLILWGSIRAGGVQGVKVQGSDNDSNWNDLEGTSISVSDESDHKITYLELAKPTYRYVRAVVSRAVQSSAVDGIVALLTGPKTAPVPHEGSTVSGAKPDTP